MSKLYLPKDELKNYEIIRKLSKTEDLYDLEVIHDNFYLTRALLFNLSQSEIDLNLLKKACSFWVKKNPLLGAEIFRSKENIREKYFVKLSDEKLFKFSNLEIIETDNELKWKHVMDQEVITRFDLSTDPLWRIKLIKMKNATCSDFNYILILTTLHQIGDGRNIYTLAIQLLNIIGALIENKICDEMEEKNREETSLIPEDNLNKFEININNNYELVYDKKSKIPDCFRNLNGTHGKMIYFSLDKDQLNKLILKMKQKAPKAKLNGVFNIVIALANKNMLEKYQVNDIPKDRFQIDTLISVREKFGLTNSYNGVYSTALITVVEGNLSYETFWQLAEKDSIDLHNKLKDNIDIKHVQEIDDLYEELYNNTYLPESMNFSVSNVGRMINTSSNVIKVVEHYLRMPSIFNRIGSSMFNSICSIDGKLCWTISYNEKITSSKIMSEFRQEILDIIHKLIEN